MTAYELKASILDRAVRGELTAAWRAECEAKGEVERRETRDTPPPDDSRLTSSPAVSSLASRVSRPTPGPTPIADPPYDLPQGWVWKRLGELGSTTNGLWKGVKKPFINVAVIRAANFTRDCELKLDNLVYIDVEVSKYEKRKLLPGDIIIERSGGGENQPVGRAVLFDQPEGEFSFCNFTSVLRIDNRDAVFPRYLQQALTALYTTGYTARIQSNTTGLRNLDFKAYLDIPIPLPPLAEQKRIVAKIEELMPLVEEYGKAETELAALNDNFPTALRKSILQHAVEGRLTARWREIGEDVRRETRDARGRETRDTPPSDVSRLTSSPAVSSLASRVSRPTPDHTPPLETAADLLAKIATEKKSLLAAGKIKKSKPLPPITEDEKPFPIPETWAWVRLGEIGTTITGSTPSTKDKPLFGNDIPFIKPAAIFEDHIDYSGDGLSLKGGEIARLIAPDSILMVCIGTIGKAYLTDRVVSCNQQINAITPFCVDTKYLLLAMQSPVFQDSAWNESSSTTISILNKSTWENLPIPLPPLAEQKAIVARVEALLKLVEEMKG